MSENKIKIGVFKTPTERAIFEFCEPRFESMGYEIVRVRFRTIKSKVKPKGKGSKALASKGSKVKSILQIMIDNISGEPIGITDCEKVSKYLSFLEEDFPVDVDYNLEISSAGIERPLTRVEDFIKFPNHRVKIMTIMPILDAQKVYRGHLMDVENDYVTMKLSHGEGDVVKIPYNSINEAYLDFTKEELDRIF